MIPIKKYLEQMRANNRSERTIETTEFILSRLNKFKSLDLIDKDDIVEFFANFTGTDSSRNLYVVIIKKYFRDDNKHNYVDWLKPVKVQETLKSEDILTTEDINKMIENTDNLYFKALIAFIFETGCRVGEIKQLKYSDFIPTTDGLIVNIPTKKTKAGYRKNILPFSSQYIMNLKTSIYAKDDDIVFNYQYGYSNTVLQKIAEKANINKKVNFHAFRHAQATLMAQQEHGESIMKKKLGWSPSSKMVGRYAHLSDEDVINATLAMSGKMTINRKNIEVLKEAKPLSLEVAANRLFQLEDENVELKEHITKIENSFQDMINIIIESKDNNNFSKMKVKLQELFNKEPDVGDIEIEKAE